ncbi:MAG TPA: hypothetical protein PK635_02335 [Actinomycetota bacterium]|nr:hypothetical protein [Actinomycetota bacterium]
MRMPAWVLPVLAMWWAVNGVYVAVVQQNAVGWFVAWSALVVLVGHQLVQEAKR